MLPLSTMENDPIGLDREHRALDRAAEQSRVRPSRTQAADQAEFGPSPPVFRVQQGEILTAVRSVRETHHRVEVDFRDGLATVTVHLGLGGTSNKPSEAHYRLAVPPDAALAELQVCNPSGCREGFAQSSQGALAYEDALLARGPANPLPVARATPQRDDRGGFISLRAAPVRKSAPLEVMLRYVCQVPQHGGLLRLVLPARGMDPRSVPGEVSLSAPGMLDARIAGAPATDAQRLDGWLPVELTARVPSAVRRHTSLWHFGCGKQRCVRARVAAGPARAQPTDLILALDVSPSMEGPARSRLAGAIATLLEAAPEGTRVRALTFAGRAQPLLPKATAAAQVSLSRFGPATRDQSLGSTTRFEAAWGLISRWLPRRGRKRVQVLIVGDGGLTTGKRSAFVQARQAGVRVSTLNLSDRASKPALRSGVFSTGGIVIDAGPAAQQAMRGEVGALTEQLLSLFTPTIARRVSLQLGGAVRQLGPLRAGTALVWEGPAPKGKAKLRVGSVTRNSSRAPSPLRRALGERLRLQGGKPAAGLVAVDSRDLRVAGKGRPKVDPRRLKKGHCDPRGPAERRSGQSSDLAPVALAKKRACGKAKAVAAKAGIGKGMPKEPLLDMLRRRIMPVARGCFRRDRAGRPDYSVRATFIFTLADREVVEARVEGDIEPKLRNCLVHAVDGLEVPRFSGTVVVRYPLVTAKEPLPAQIELTPNAARSVDRLLDDVR